MSKDKTKALRKKMKQQQKSQTNQELKQAWSLYKKGKRKGKLERPKPGANPELIYLVHKELTEQALLTPKFSIEDVQEQNIQFLNNYEGKTITAVGLVTDVDFSDELTPLIQLSRPQLAEVVGPNEKQQPTLPLNKDLWINLNQVTHSNIGNPAINIGDLFGFTALVENNECTEITILASGFLHKEVNENKEPIVTSDYPRHDEEVAKWDHELKLITLAEPKGWVKDLIDKKKKNETQKTIF